MLDVINGRVDEEIKNFLPDVQCGQQVTQVFVQYPAGTGTNSCTVFAGLEKAYDMIPRELAICCWCTCDLEDKMKSFGLKNTDLGWSLHVVRCDGSVLYHAGMDIRLVDLVE